MPDTPTPRGPQDPAEDNASNGTGSLDELRYLILAPEQQAIEQLHRRLDDPESRTEDVSSVVAEAIQRRRIKGGDEALSVALSPTVESALRESVRRDPTTLADALFPVMGPAIRRSILETLRSFLDSFNEVMDQSLSWQGLKWRVEAVRTGRSFTEVALLHSLVFRVEQVFLIHKKTGLPLGHLSAPAVAMQDPSLVSGMLSAIQDFVRDSFQSEKGQGIERMNVGDLDVWVEESPYAILALVIRGIAPRAIRDRMAETLETIHAQYAEQLANFQGETAPFARINDNLRPCLEARYKEEPKRHGRGYVWAAAGLVLAFILGFFGWRWWQFHEWNNLAATLAQQPGYSIASVTREGGKFVIRGLRDPLAPEIAPFVQQAGLNIQRANFQLRPYYSLDDSIVQQRATQALAPPAGVSLNVQNGVLSLPGNAPLPWLHQVAARASQIPGVQRVDFAGLTAEQLHAREIQADLQNVVVRFPVGSDYLTNAERAALRTLVDQIRPDLTSSIGLPAGFSIAVVGHCDNTGAETTNLTLSQRRAERVQSELEQLGVPHSLLQAKGVATSEPVRQEDSEAGRQFNRSVTFRTSPPAPAEKP